MVDGRNVSAIVMLQIALKQQRAFRPHAFSKTNTASLCRCTGRHARRNAACIAQRFVWRLTFQSSVVGGFCRVGLIL